MKTVKVFCKGCKSEFEYDVDEASLDDLFVNEEFEAAKDALPKKIYMCEEVAVLEGQIGDACIVKTAKVLRAEDLKFSSSLAIGVVVEMEENKVRRRKPANWKKPIEEQ